MNTTARDRSRKPSTHPPCREAELSEAHRRMLFDESGLSSEVVEEREARTITRLTDLPPEFKGRQRRNGLLLPLYSPDGKTTSHQLRPDKPIKAGRKYEQPAGVGCILDVHPRMMGAVRDGRRDLWVTEGVKKADALTGQGLCTITLAGVWNWGRKGEMLPCWDHVALNGRRVYVVFDSDVMTKEGPQMALERLVRALEARGAEVLVVYLPEVLRSGKTGVDDYLAAGHSVNELKALARKFEPLDLGRVRLSRDGVLRDLVEDLQRTFWAHEWKGQGGYTDRDVFKEIVEAAARGGKPHPEGLRVKLSHGTLAIWAKVSSRTLCKSIVRLEGEGLLYRDNAGRKADKAGAFVVRAGVKQVGESSATEAKKAQGRKGHCPGTLHLRAPRLRWSTPAVKPRRGTVLGTRRVRRGPPPQGRNGVERLGKKRGAIVDAVDSAGGCATVQELGAALHMKRPRDLVRRKSTPAGRDGPVIMLEEAGILSLDGDVMWLAADWLDRFEEARRLGGEIEAEEADRRHLWLKRQAYHGHREAAPDHHPSNAGADGWTEGLAPLPDPPDPWTLTGAIGSRVQTTRGPGVLWDHKGGVARVVLDASPKGWTPLDVCELILPKTGAA